MRNCRHYSPPPLPTHDAAAVAVAVADAACHTHLLTNLFICHVVAAPPPSPSLSAATAGTCHPFLPHAVLRSVLFAVPAAHRLRQQQRRHWNFSAIKKTQQKSSRRQGVAAQKMQLK